MVYTVRIKQQSGTWRAVDYPKDKAEAWHRYSRQEQGGWVTAIFEGNRKIYANDVAYPDETYGHYEV
jgi:hypothetical protein